MLSREQPTLSLQSKDGGQTWEDISYGLPGHEQPEDFLPRDPISICVLRMSVFAVEQS